MASGLGEQEPPPAQSFTALSTHSQFIRLCSGSHFYKFFENFTGYALITHRTPLTPCAPPPPPHPPGAWPSSSFFPFPSLREPGNAKCGCSTRDHHDPPPSSQGPTAVQPAAKPSSRYAGTHPASVCEGPVSAVTTATSSYVQQPGPVQKILCPSPVSSPTFRTHNLLAHPCVKIPEPRGRRDEPNTIHPGQSPPQTPPLGSGETSPVSTTRETPYEAERHIHPRCVTATSH